METAFHVKADIIINRMNANVEQNEDAKDTQQKTCGWNNIFANQNQCVTHNLPLSQLSPYVALFNVIQVQYLTVSDPRL